MIERERTMASMDFTNRHRDKDDGATGKLDIEMLVKLTTRLQEASYTYENLRGDMDKIKEDNKKLQEENRNLVRENSRLREEPKFSKSPQRYSHYTMAGLQTKVGQYEREVQQLRRALRRSDTYVEDLTNKLESSTGPSSSKPKRAHLRTSPVPSSCTITSLTDDRDPSEKGKNSDVIDVENPSPPEDASLPVDGSLKKKISTANDNENVTPNGHSPVLAPVSSERFSLENTTSYGGEERESGLSSRRSSEVSLYGQDLDIPPGPLTSSLNVLEPVEGEALDRPPSRGELLLLGDPSGRRQEKPALEENLNMFTARRRLMMMSERRARQRDSLEPSKLLRDLGSCSPTSSEGGKRKSIDAKSLDFDLFTSAPGEDSPSNSVSQENSSPPPAFNRDPELTESGSPCFHTFSLAKIKSEIEVDNEDENTAKKPRLDSDEFPDAEEEEKEEKS
ncbi:RING finger protein 219 [Stylophora pistillata]|uniref:RING finger protein 219 n=2 Tax=Stylophora pistillata TaxID=50429 RepID=A0A2B4SKU5_STYPI|nr:RING finger protein 219 [Stylophora pistillata]